MKNGHGREGGARIGVDVGGTFTDLVLEAMQEEGPRVFVHKVASTPSDQSQGVLSGMIEICRMAGIRPEDVALVVHGTTVATNITLEHTGAEVGMLTTRGFRDILHIARHKRPHNFSMQFDVPWQSKPLVRRRNRIPIRERILPPDGSIAEPLAEDEVRAAAALFKSRGIEAVIIAFLFSFLNDAHERRAAEIVREAMPEAYVCRSSEVIDVMREYERFSTTAMNAYVGPKTSFYLRGLETKMRQAGFSAELRIMQSNGGVATVETCAGKAVTILMSGPAGGVIGGRWAGEMSGERNLITIDIGGTSADISTIPGGEIRIMNPRDTSIGDYPVLAPMIDLATIGAGGGSIAYIDEGGAFRVGPRSAGADPGPACYGKGGKQPTVTDAQVVLGRLDADKLLGGDLKLDRSLAARAISEKLARPLGLSLEEAALGVLRVINSNMALAIRANSVARGHDPREFALMAFGGAGPLHGAALATEIAAREMIVPPAPGITAAIGLLVTDMRYEFTRSVLVLLDRAGEGDLARINEHIARLEASASAQLLADGVPRARQIFSRIAECRYQGQGFELRAAMPGEPLTFRTRDQVMANFHEAHRRDYGYAFEGSPVEVVTLRVIGSAAVEPLRWPELARAEGADAAAACLYSRPTVFDDGSRLDTPRYDRDRLLAGHVVPGPAIILQHNATTLVPPGHLARVERSGNLHVQRVRSA